MFRSRLGVMVSIIFRGTPHSLAISVHLDVASLTWSIISAAFLMLFEAAHSNKSFLVTPSNFR